MAIKSGFAHQELELVAQFVTHGRHLLANFVQPLGSVGQIDTDAGGAAILPKGLAHHIAPFSSCYTGFGRGNGRGHDIAALNCGFAQRIQGQLGGLRVTGCAPCLQARNLISLCGGINTHDGIFPCGERA